MKRENKKAQTVEQLSAQLTNAQRANAASNAPFKAKVEALAAENTQLKKEVAELNAKIVELAASKEVAAQA